MRASAEAPARPVRPRAAPVARRSPRPRTRAFKAPSRARVVRIRDRLRELYGTPLMAPHGHPIAEYDRFLECFIELAGVQRVSLIMHDWGAVGLVFAQRRPELIERLVLINAVTFLPGYRWHRTARIWRTPVLGELSMGITGRRVLRLLSRESNATPGPMPEEWLDGVLAHLDHGTQRAILRLYRSSPTDALEAAGAHLGRLDMPALVAWGMRDPYIPERFGRAFADAIPGAELLELPDAGHWPWLDRPDLVERLVAFVTA